MEFFAEIIILLIGDKLYAKEATVGGMEAHVLTGLTPILANASGFLWTAA